MHADRLNSEGDDREENDIDLKLVFLTSTQFLTSLPIGRVRRLCSFLAVQTFFQDVLHGATAEFNLP